MSFPAAYPELTCCSDSPAPEGSPLKRRKISKATRVSVQWQTLLADISDFDLHHAKMKSKLVFSFVEGPLVKAMKSGEWYVHMSNGCY